MTATVTLVRRPKMLVAILVGGGVAGALDLTSAFITFGWRVPQGIASGLLGQKSFQGGAATWILGVLLHFFIAFSAASVYCLASGKLPFLKEHFFVCGLFYGIGVYLVMQLIVLPLSAIPFETNMFTLRGLIQGLLAHMFLIGLPIVQSVEIWEIGLRAFGMTVKETNAQAKGTASHRWLRHRARHSSEACVTDGRNPGSITRFKDR